MCDWAEHEFSLSKSDDKGITRREHLEQVKKATKRDPEGLENPHEFPKLLNLVWSFFIQLSQSRTAGFSGPNPITYTEIQAWANLTQTRLNPYDVGIIKRLDSIYLKAIS